MKSISVAVWCTLLLVVPVSTIGAQESTLRRGFRDIQLGSTFQEAQERLASEGAFAYRGEPDLSMSLSRSESVIDSEGRGFVDRGLLQFSSDRLYILTLYLDQTQLDYFQMFEQLVSRYGDPPELTPRWARWEDDRTRIELERPLTVRYLDRQVLQELGSRVGIERAIGSEERDRFLEEF